MATRAAQLDTSQEVRRRTTESRGIRTYLHRILSEASPGTSISKSAMDCTNALMTLTVERLVKGSLIIAQRVGNVTVTADDIRAATEIALPPELADNAVQAGNDALNHYWREASTSSGASVASPSRAAQAAQAAQASRGSRNVRTSGTSVGSPAASRKQYDAAASAVLTASGRRRQPVRRASRAELIMAPPRIETMTRSIMQREARTIQRSNGPPVTIQRLSEDASVFLAAVVQYLAEELFRVGGICTSEASRRLMRDVELVAGLRRHNPLSDLAGGAFLARYSQPDGNTEEEPLESSQSQTA